MFCPANKLVTKIIKQLFRTIGKRLFSLFVQQLTFSNTAWVLITKELRVNCLVLTIMHRVRITKALLILS